MKKSRKQKSRSRKQKSKTRKQKGGDICEKNDILKKLDDSLAKYKNATIIQESAGFRTGRNYNYKIDQDIIIMSLFEEIKKCDNIKNLIESIKNLIERKKMLSFFNSDEKEFYEKLLKKFKSPIEQEQQEQQEQQEIIIKKLSEYLEDYKKNKSLIWSEISIGERIRDNKLLTLNQIIDSRVEHIIDSLYESIKNYDKDTITDIIKKQNRFSFLDSDKKEFYEKILEKFESQESQESKLNDSI